MQTKIGSEATDINKSKEALRATDLPLEKAYGLLRGIIDGTIDLIAAVDTNFRYLTFNKAYLDEIKAIYGIDLHVGDSMTEVLAQRPEDLKNATEVFRSAFEGKSIVTTQTYGDIGKSVRIYELHISPIYDSQGCIIGAAHINTEVTQRKKTEEALRETTQHYRALFDNQTIGLSYCKTVFDEHNEAVDYVILDVNETWASQVGVNKNEVLGKKITEAFKGVNQELVNRHNRVAVTGQEDYFETYEPVTKQWYNIKVYSPKRGYFIALIFNISERKKTEEALKRLNADLDSRVHERTKQIEVERQRLFNVLESIPSMVILLAPDHKVAFANRSFRTRFGEPNGRRCYDFCFGNKEPCSFCESYKVLETGKPHHWIVNAPDGSIIDAYDFPFTDIDGTKMVLEMDVDITEQKKIEHQLKANERLAAIGATAGMVGHDIRNPLQAITGDIYLLKDALMSIPDITTKREMTESLDEIEKNISYIDKIVADLQDYSRRIIPELKIVNLYELVVNAFRTIGIPQNISPVIEIDSKINLKTDITLFTRILTNLVINAIQAMPDGGELSIAASKKQQTIVVSVKDTGVGIPENVKSKLFTPMTTTKSKGQGLGLAVVKRLVEALNGAITFESQEGKGTEFTVELPANMSV